MSFTTIVTLSCNTVGCKTQPVTGTERTATFFAARKEGWECINAAEQYCPACRALRHPKPAKVEKVEAKPTKAATKPSTKKVAAVKAIAAQVTKKNAKPVAAKIGQSTGKPAKSAKK